jgi:hypothetical protein
VTLEDERRFILLALAGSLSGLEKTDKPPDKTVYEEFAAKKKRLPEEIAKLYVEH